MLILSELVLVLLGGALRFLEMLLLVMTSAVVAAPQVLQPGVLPSSTEFVRFLTWPIRAAARHPWRLAFVLLVAAIWLAASWRA